MGGGGWLWAWAPEAGPAPHLTHNVPTHTPALMSALPRVTPPAHGAEDTGT